MESKFGFLDQLKKKKMQITITKVKKKKKIESEVINLRTIYFPQLSGCIKRKDVFSTSV